MKKTNCVNCGAKLEEPGKYCISCGTFQDNEEEEKQKIYVSSKDYPEESKSRLAAGLLGVFLGAYGIHNFYLGYTTKAVIQLLLSTIGWVFVVGPIISYIWGFIEGIMIISGSIKEDANGVKLKD